jgi:hypothetical protein
MNLEGVIDTCNKACLEFVEKLKQWMPSPNDPSIFHRARIQAHTSTIRACRNIVRDTKATVVLAEVVAIKSVTMYPIFVLCR